MIRLKYWARFSPANHRHKYDLCAAEYARVIGNENAARLAYDCAITGASSFGSTGVTTLGCRSTDCRLCNDT